MEFVLTVQQLLEGIQKGFVVAAYARPGYLGFLVTMSDASFEEAQRQIAAGNRYWTNTDGTVYWAEPLCPPNYELVYNNGSFQGTSPELLLGDEGWARFCEMQEARAQAAEDKDRRQQRYDLQDQQFPHLDSGCYQAERGGPEFCQ